MNCKHCKKQMGQKYYSGWNIAKRDSVIGYCCVNPKCKNFLKARDINGN